MDDGQFVWAYGKLSIEFEVFEVKEFVLLASKQYDRINPDTKILTLKYPNTTSPTCMIIVHRC
jgi:hypothetical protein